MRFHSIDECRVFLKINVIQLRREYNDKRAACAVLSFSLLLLSACTPKISVQEWEAQRRDVSARAKAAELAGNYAVACPLWAEINFGTQQGRCLVKLGDLKAAEQVLRAEAEKPNNLRYNEELKLGLAELAAAKGESGALSAYARDKETRAQAKVSSALTTIQRRPFDFGAAYDLAEAYRSSDPSKSAYYQNRGDTLSRVNSVTQEWWRSAVRIGDAGARAAEFRKIYQYEIGEYQKAGLNDLANLRVQEATKALGQIARGESGPVRDDDVLEPETRAASGGLLGAIVQGVAQGLAAGPGTLPTAPPPSGMTPSYPSSPAYSSMPPSAPQASQSRGNTPAAQCLLVSRLSPYRASIKNNCGVVVHASLKATGGFCIAPNETLRKRVLSGGNIPDAAENYVVDFAWGNPRLASGAPLCDESLRVDRNDF